MSLQKLSNVNNKDCIIVIPVYKSVLEISEKISLFQCIKVLGQSYEICIVYPETVDIGYYHKITNGFSFDLLACNEEYFKSTATYSLLCENAEFYRIFQDYEFMLIYQLDGWVFENNLEYFLRQDFDYNGSPWQIGSYGFNHIQVGNGGVSLRRISTFISLCESINKYDLESKYAPTEDVFFCKYIKSIKKNIPFNIAPAGEGCKFSFTTMPYSFYKMNNDKLPMFAHGWLRGYDFEEFWHKYIPLDTYKNITDLDYNFYENKIRETADNKIKGSDQVKASHRNYDSMLDAYLTDYYGSQSKGGNGVFDDYYGINKPAQAVNVKKDSNILICIFNYRHDVNAMKWLNLLSPYFETVVLDSGNDHTVKEFTQFPNIYYSGLWNEMKNLSEKKEYEWVGLITSDVEIKSDAVKLIERINWLRTTSNLGCWTLLGDLYGHSNKFTYAMIEGEQPYRAFEGFFMFIKDAVLKKMDYIDLNINKYGHGIDFVTCFVSNKFGYINKVDEDIYIYHPTDKGYSREEAEKCYRMYENEIKKKYPEYRRKVKAYKSAQPEFEKKVEYKSVRPKNKNVIYTCISGNYDQLMPVKNKQDNWDYVCFTDQDITSDIWQIRKIPDELNMYSQVKRQRLLKILCYKYLSEYTNTIWIDANIDIKENTNLNEFVSRINNNKMIAYKKHPQRDCIYDELTACVHYHKDTLENTELLRKRYKDENFPEHFGLYETGVIYRNNNSDILCKLMDMWAYELIHNSHRDQLSLNYCIWKLDCVDDISVFDETLFKEYFIKYKHKKY